MKFVLYVIKVTVIGYILIGLMLFVFQRSLIYFPTDWLEHGFTETVFENADEKINVITLNVTSQSAILYFGGNAETVAFTATDFNEKLSSYAIYLVNYRGYGGSSGSPEEQGLYSDALKIYDSLSDQCQTIHVIGRSLGSGVATYIASQRPVSKLVLITPFDSIQNIAQNRFPFYPMSILLQDKFDSAKRAANINAETLILSAEKDKVVSAEHTTRLIESFSLVNPRVVVIPQSGHNSIANNEQYYQAIHAFLK